MQQEFNDAADPTPEQLGQRLLEQVCQRKECNVGLALNLISEGAALEMKLRGSTALGWAAYNDHPAIARALLAQGADMDARDSTNKTALDWAMQFNHGDVLLVFMAEQDRRDKAAAEKALRDSQAFDLWRENGMPLQESVIVSGPLKFRPRY